MTSAAAITPSDFRPILEKLVKEAPRAWGAIFVDWEGEAVDLHAVSDEYRVKLAGAHSGLLLNRLVSAAREAGRGRTRSVFVKASDAHLFLHMLDEEYFVLLATHPSPDVARCRFLLARAVTDLAHFV